LSAAILSAAMTESSDRSLALALSIFGLIGTGSERRPAPSPAEGFPDDDLPPPGPRCFT
jgi:hypothetical protein